jgi:hypothetical protein
MSAPTHLVPDFIGGPDSEEPRQILANEELAERRPTLPALSAGGKT